MNKLDKDWTFNFIFYFIDISKGTNILVLTDHEERLKINNQFLNLNISYFLANDENINTLYESIKTKFKNKKFNHIIFDTNRKLPDNVFYRILNQWDQRGSVIYLDWSSDWKNSLKGMVNHFTQVFLTSLFKYKKYNFKKRFFNVPTLIQTDLENPKNLIFRGAYLADPGFKIKLKNWLIKSGLFYLLTQNKIIILQKNNDKNSPALRVLRKINEEFNLDYQIGLNRFRWLLISTTGVLIACLNLKKTGYIIRFPLTEKSVKRLEQQHKILRLLEEHGVEFVPRSFALKDDEMNLSVFVEQKINGDNNLFFRLKNDKKVILTAYEQIYPIIENIHLAFGDPCKIGENIFNEFIASKLDLIKTRLENNLIDAKQVSNIKENLFSYLYNKKVYITLCHGDLKVPNTIYDRKGNVKGIIDWDMAEEKELNLFDVGSLLGNTIRLLIYPKDQLYRFIQQIDKIPEQLLNSYEQYFSNTKTSWIDPNVALFLYWIDRTYKMLKYKDDISEKWLTKNIMPGLNRASFFLKK